MTLTKNLVFKSATTYIPAKHAYNPPVTSIRPYSFIDLTGDGRSEFINSYDPEATQLPGSTNKVGLTQFLAPNGSWISSSTNRAQTDWNLPDELLATDTFTPLNFAEVDGDGVADIFRTERLKTTAPDFRTSGARTYLRRGLSKPARINKITNGLGVPIDVEYGQLPALAAATYNTNSDPNGVPSFAAVADPHYKLGGSNGGYPYQNQTPAVTVVTKYTTLDGSENADGVAGNEVTSSYYYTGLRYHALKGNLGFEKIEKRSSLSPIRQETIYSQSGDTYGLPLESTTFTINAQGQRQLLSRSTNLYQTDYKFYATNVFYGAELSA